jgi:hypothetical protein
MRKNDVLSDNFQIFKFSHQHIIRVIRLKFVKFVLQ